MAFPCPAQRAESGHLSVPDVHSLQRFECRHVLAGNDLGSHYVMLRTDSLDSTPCETPLRSALKE